MAVQTIWWDSYTKGQASSDVWEGYNPMQMQQAHMQTLLVVEDSPEDFYAVRRGLASAGFDSNLVRCDSGEDALDYLHRSGRYADDPDVAEPALILLDLNLPGLSGGEVLDRIKTDPSLCRIPVVVVSNSGEASDIDSSYCRGASSYLRKSLHEDRVMEDMRHLNKYWFNTVMLPKRDEKR